MDLVGVVVRIGITYVMALHLIVSYASYRSVRFDQLLASAPDLLLRDGRSRPDGLRHARMNEADLDVQLRRCGRTRREDVAEANLEATGETSIRLTEGAHAARRRDVRAGPGA
jgi:uncharacterized membrane protein YcaP (DUF421 family)